MLHALLADDLLIQQEGAPERRWLACELTRPFLDSCSMLLIEQIDTHKEVLMMNLSIHLLVGVTGSEQLHGEMNSNFRVQVMKGTFFPLDLE